MNPSSSPAPSAFAAAYSDALRELSTTELNKIKLLRDLARENPAEGPHIVAALCNHLRMCPPAYRLPALYLLDCVMKTAEGPYPSLVPLVLPEVFAHLWDAAGPELRAKLAKTANTWTQEYLPPAIMSIIQAKMQPPQQSLLFNSNLRPATATQYAMPGSAMQPILLAPKGDPRMQQPTYLYPMMPQPLATYQQPPMQLPYAVQQSYGSASSALFGAASAAASTGSANLAATLLNLGQKLGLAASSGPQDRAGAVSQAAAAPQAAATPGVEALLAASAQTRGKFLDLQFYRNQRRQGDGHRVRPWYVEVDKWLLGTRATVETVALFEEGEDMQGAGGSAPTPLVEEDPAQPTCAVSGEPFERTYDPETDKWYYEDAVVLTPEQAAAYGVMEGSICKVQALAGAPPASVASAGVNNSQARVGAQSQLRMHDVTAAIATAAESAAAESSATAISKVAPEGVSQSKRGGDTPLGAPEQKRPKQGIA
eukprot:CAMPEP_0119109264 /NCGR_PEP_ID=MMETSP1180-20130426/17815_1 /TAXON_ID=3052 ORGANISM="Chlamydomonas cf sp, Strain CCMP681" /NCGR_SAMPLE_ID=MMETSP1180 /ASSEMBLY_ACC=CAM_ASM_000741 /LENGTH=482 /DNA_ID=CAMNT_0007095005 /DNA_START=101 /DNA_END=1546 /DNA_ORIENTATION=+